MSTEPPLTVFNLNVTVTATLTADPTVVAMRQAVALKEIEQGVRDAGVDDARYQEQRTQEAHFRDAVLKAIEKAVIDLGTALRSNT